VRLRVVLLPRALAGACGIEIPEARVAQAVCVLEPGRARSKASLLSPIGVRGPWWGPPPRWAAWPARRRSAAVEEKTRRRTPARTMASSMHHPGHHVVPVVLAGIGHRLAHQRRRRHVHTASIPWARRTRSKAGPSPTSACSKAAPPAPPRGDPLERSSSTTDAVAVGQQLLGDDAPDVPRSPRHQDAHAPLTTDEEECCQKSDEEGGTPQRPAAKCTRSSVPSHGPTAKASPKVMVYSPMYCHGARRRRRVRHVGRPWWGEAPSPRRSRSRW
jgi:hypothetical protein